MNFNKMAMPSAFNDIFTLPPIYEGSMIITQPLRSETPGSNTDIHSRECQDGIILSNIDFNDVRDVEVPRSWVSALTRFQTSPISPEYFLSSIERLEIQSIINVSASGADKQYRVRSRDQLETLFLATEDSIRWQRNILGSTRHLNLILRDASGAVAFTLTKGVSSGRIPGFLHKMTVETPTKLLGYIQQTFTCFGLRFEINDIVEQNNRLAAVINGPMTCCLCCTVKNVYFQIISPDGTRQIASIMHQWDYLLLDYTLLVTFPANTDVKLKSLILGAAFLLEVLFFDW